MTLQLYRPDGKGGLEPTKEQPADWRSQLRSPRWGRRLSKGQIAELSNPEMNPTSRPRSIALWVGLAALTFVLLVVGYGTAFWH